MADPMQVEVVAADRVVWSGRASNIIAKTVEGDIGILPGHSPVLAILVPRWGGDLLDDNNREIVAVDGGFISVAQGRVSILSEYARMADEISLTEAEKEPGRGPAGSMGAPRTRTDSTSFGRPPKSVQLRKLNRPIEQKQARAGMSGTCKAGWASSRFWCSSRSASRCLSRCWPAAAAG